MKQFFPCSLIESVMMLLGSLMMAGVVVYSADVFVLIKSIWVGFVELSFMVAYYLSLGGRYYEISAAVGLLFLFLVHVNQTSERKGYEYAMLCLLALCFVLQNTAMFLCMLFDAFGLDYTQLEAMILLAQLPIISHILKRSTGYVDKELATNDE